MRGKRALVHRSLIAAKDDRQHPTAVSKPGARIRVDSSERRRRSRPPSDLQRGISRIQPRSLIGRQLTGRNCRLNGCRTNGCRANRCRPKVRWRCVHRDGWSAVRGVGPWRWAARPATRRFPDPERGAHNRIEPDQAADSFGRRVEMCIPPTSGARRVPAKIDRMPKILLRRGHFLHA